jgi:ABC-type glycerol-3-phosphate transport system permease component
MIPRISLIIPTFVIIKKIQLSGTLLATILPIIYYPVGLYLSRLYFETIPISLLESARLDGANEIQILSKIVLPLSKPIITCLALFSSINVLQDYIWQMLVLQKENNYTLLVGMMRLAMNRQGGTEANINPLSKAMASGVILLFPLLVIFLIANKYFTKSLAGYDGAVKE